MICARTIFGLRRRDKEGYPTFHCTCRCEGKRLRGSPDISKKPAIEGAIEKAIHLASGRKQAGEAGLSLLAECRILFQIRAIGDVKLIENTGQILQPVADLGVFEDETSHIYLTKRSA
jgi:hypothetical protein